MEFTFTDDADNEESLTSAATDAVAAADPRSRLPSQGPRSHGNPRLCDPHLGRPQDESITGYVILRRVRENDQGGDFSVLVANTGSAATTYTDNEVAASTTYTYRIKAINGAGTSERSRWVHIDTPAPPVPDQPTASRPRRPTARSCSPGKTRGREHHRLRDPAPPSRGRPGGPLR